VYTYDARGHVLTKTIGTAVSLRNAYDDAERLLSITDANTDAVLKVFTYDTVEPGQLATQTRNNEFPDSRYTVTSTFAYDADTGRASGKVTDLTKVDLVTGAVSPLQFSQAFTYTQLGAPAAVKYPTCATCGTAALESRDLALTYQDGLLTDIENVTAPLDPVTEPEGISYTAAGAVHRVQHARAGGGPGVLDTFEPDADGMARLQYIRFDQAKGCNLITAPPLDQFILSGGPATLTVSVVAGASVQWFEGPLNDTSTPRGTGATLSLPSVGHETAYWCRVSMPGGGCEDQRSVRVHVCEPIVISSPLGSALTALAGETVTIAPMVNGTNLHYEWLIHNTVVGTGARLLFQAGSGIGTQTTIGVRITDACGQVVEQPNVATVTVIAPSVCEANFELALDPRVTVPVPNAGQRLEVRLAEIPSARNPAYNFRWIEDGALMHEELDRGARTSSYDMYVRDDDKIVRVEAWVSCQPESGGRTTSPTIASEAYGTVHGRCTPPAVTVSAVEKGDHSAFILHAEPNRGDVSYQWYTGNSGDTKLPVDGGTAAQLEVPFTAALYWVRVTTTDHCERSVDSATLPVSTPSCSPVVLQQQPQDQFVAAGTAVRMSVMATSSPLPSKYAWYRSPSSQIMGASEPTYTAHPIRTTDYWASVGNGCHATVTRKARVHVTSCADISVTAQPADLSIPAGSSASLSITASGPDALLYQWYEGASGDTTAPIAGANSATLSLPTPHSGQYWVRVSFSDPNKCAVDSRTATVTICGTPTVTAFSQPKSTVPGQNHIIGVNASGERLSYEWFVGSVPSEAGRLSSTSDIAQVHPTTTTTYVVRVTSDCAAPLADRSTLTTIKVSVCPTIISGPTTDHLTVVAGALTTVVMPNGRKMVSIDAPADAVVEWFLRPVDNSAPEVSIGTTESIQTPPITRASYVWARVSSGSCTTESEAIVIQLCSGLSFIWNGGINRSVTQGSTQSISAQFAGAETASFAMYEGPAGNVAGSVLIDASNIISVTSNATRQFWGRATDPTTGCFVDTPALTIEVCVPAITAQPQSVLLDKTGNPSAAVTLSVTATPNNAPLTYQWYIGQPGNTTQPIAGATSNTYGASPSSDTTYWVRVSGLCGGTAPFTKDSAAAVVTVCRPPAISTQPSSVTYNPGTTPVLQVTATGTELTYRWYTGVSGNTSAPTTNTTATFSITPATTTDYWVRVSGRCGTADSNTAKISIRPTINTQPIGGPITSGTTRTLTVAAAGSQLTYQWYSVNGATSAAIAGATGASYVTPAVTTNSSYYCVVTSGTAFTQSATATLTVCQSRAVTYNGSDVSGSPRTLSMTTPQGDETFEWYAGTSGNVATPLGPGTTKTVSPTQTSMYWVRTRTAACTSDSATVTIVVCRPAITTQPQSAIVAANTQRTLTVAATGTPTLSYQWYRGVAGDTTQPIAGANAPSYTTPPLTASGSYWARVTSPLGSGCSVNSTNSTAATLTVCQPPAISAGPAAVAVTSTENATFQVTATGDALNYQWYEGAAGVTTTPVGTNSRVLTIKPGSTKSYWVRVSGTCGTADSNAVLASVYPIMTTPPVDAAICNLGESVTFTAGASGSNVTYRWERRVNGGAWEMLAVTTPTLTIAVPQLPAIFQAFAKSGNAETGADPVSVTLNAKPAITSISRTFLYTGTYRLTAFVPTEDQDLGVTYTWYQGPIGNTTTQIGTSYYVNVTPAAPVTYWVRVRFVTTGCYADKATSF
jgi:YD repeat-containing protein